MDFLKNAAKIAEQVQGGKSHGGGGGSGGYGFMGGDKPKPRRDEEEQDYEQQQERPHGSQSQSSAEHKKKPSTGELFSDARVGFFLLYAFLKNQSSFFVFMLKLLCQVSWFWFQSIKLVGFSIDSY